MRSAQVLHLTSLAKRLKTQEAWEARPKAAGGKAASLKAALEGRFVGSLQVMKRLKRRPLEKKRLLRCPQGEAA